jgi:hypothetical protein
MIDANVNDAIQKAIGWLQEALRLLQISQGIEAPIEEQLPPTRQVAWGKKVSQTFKERVLWIADDLGCNPDHLMACMAWESAETFRPDIKNAAGSGATGLIQFMPATARGLKTTTDKLAAMSAEDQLRFVYEYFKPYAGRLNNLGDVYMAILWPKGVGKEDHFVLFDRAKTPTTFRQNAGLDVNRDGLVTRAECLVKVNEKLAKGLKLAA